MATKFYSRDYHFRPANGIASALQAAGAHVPLIREPRAMTIYCDGKRKVHNLPHNGKHREMNDGTPNAAVLHAA